LLAVGIGRRDGRRVMSCRWSCRSWPRAPLDRLAEEHPDLLVVLADLARSHRQNEFRWLARSQGVPGEDVEALWASLSVLRDR
jgi:hypothetical protein